MGGCPKHQDALDAKCPACKKLEGLLIRVARDTMAGKKPPAHTFSKGEIDSRIKIIEDENKLRDASPYCAKHFPKGGVRCMDCVMRTMTPADLAHRDVQATLLGTPLPLRPEEIKNVDLMIQEFIRIKLTQVISRKETQAVLLKFGVSEKSAASWTKELFVAHDKDHTDVVFLTDFTAFAKRRPPRLIQVQA